VDPIANLKEQIELAREIQAINDRGEDIDYADLAAKAARLSELALALDEWQRKGGFSPYAKRDRLAIGDIVIWPGEKERFAGKVIATVWDHNQTPAEEPAMIEVEPFEFDGYDDSPPILLRAAEVKVATMEDRVELAVRTASGEFWRIIGAHFPDSNFPAEWPPFNWQPMVEGFVRTIADTEGGDNG
jgi:hypothetical protein